VLLHVGNYESAVESCFKAGRLADALLIANIFNRCEPLPLLGGIARKAACYLGARSRDADES
jgi:hypothetical protein